MSCWSSRTFLRLLDIETRKTLNHPALWLGLLALFLLLGVFTLFGHLQSIHGIRPARGGLEQDLFSGLAFYHWTGVLAYAVIGAAITVFDYPDRSIQLWLGRGVERSLLLSARLAAMLFFGLLVVCYAVTLLLAFGALSRFFLFDGVAASNLDLSALLPVSLRTFWSGLPYLALALQLAVVSHSPLAAAAGNIIYGCVFEVLALQAGGKFPPIIRYLPVSLSQVLQDSNAALDRAAPLLPLNTALMSQTQAIMWIGVLFVVLSAVSLIIFFRQDLGG